VDSDEVVAAGAVVSRKGPEVLLVHRPKYDDWSFPKGKVDPGEHVLAAAVREVAEETGLHVRLGPPLRDQEYVTGNGTLRPKRVHYWTGRQVDGDISTYEPNNEIDQLAWLSIAKARKRLTYEHDRNTLDEFVEVRKRSTPLVLLRHAKATSRKSWDGDDPSRPLSEVGQGQSDALIPLLAAYGVRRVVSSSSTRCWETLAPYAEANHLDLEVADALSEELVDEAGLTELVAELLDDKQPAVICSHRPILPLLTAALGVPDPSLEPAGMLVVHHRKGKVVSTEQHGL
jgi:8-oxo-(d)GTP phosphatase